MRELLIELMSAAAGRCSYADARRIARTEERVVVRNGALERVERETSDGIGVRVRTASGWAFAATSDLSAQGAEAALARALAIADAQPRAPAVPLAPAPPAHGAWRGPGERDPVDVPLHEKVDLLLAAEGALRGDRRLAVSRAECLSVRVERAFASTEGAATEQEHTACGGGIGAVAVDGEEVQQRSYPGQYEGDVGAGGFERLEALDLAGAAPRVAEEVVALLTAPPCPAGTATLVLHHEQLALQLHESIGHALELDRMLGGEESYAGTSWVGVEDLGRLRYGSELLDVTADATLPGGLGTCAWDDEGVQSRRYPLISAGVLVDALSSRESAGAIGREASGGCMRAERFDRQPIVRMTNVSLEPGDAGTLADLIADTDRGIYLETNRSWSIDDRRLNFRFATEIAREIRGGELGRLYRNPSYSGVTPRFWSSLDAVCSESEWRPWGTVNCGKGEPGQVAHVSHGTAPARFRDVEVGAA